MKKILILIIVYMLGIAPPVLSQVTFKYSANETIDAKSTIGSTEDVMLLYNVSFPMQPASKHQTNWADPQFEYYTPGNGRDAGNPSRYATGTYYYISTTLLVGGAVLKIAIALEAGDTLYVMDSNNKPVDFTYNLPAMEGGPSQQLNKFNQIKQTSYGVIELALPAMKNNSFLIYSSGQLGFYGFQYSPGITVTMEDNTGWRTFYGGSWRGSYGVDFSASKNLRVFVADQISNGKVRLSEIETKRVPPGQPVLLSAPEGDHVGVIDNSIPAWNEGTNLLMLAKDGSIIGLGADANPIIPESYNNYALRAINRTPEFYLLEKTGVTGYAYIHLDVGNPDIGKTVLAVDLTNVVRGELRRAIEAAEAIDDNVYTAESVHALGIVLANARSILDNSTATIETMQTSMAEINEAIDNLQVKDVVNVAVGDVNGDGEVNVTDLVPLVNMILGITQSNAAADVNGDGEVNVTDLVPLVNLILNY